MRPSHDEWGLRGAEWAAQRATCIRRSVGCVLTNEKHQVLSTGYNGRAAGLNHCNFELKSMVARVKLVKGKFDARDAYPHACAGAWEKSGQGLDACEAIHAEQNALLQCRNVYEIEACYVTVSPCLACVKLLMNTSCRKIILRNRYAHDEPARKLWVESMYVEPNGNRWRREWTSLSPF